MMEIVRSTPQICCAAQLLNIVVRKKFTKAEVIKRMMKEHKATFGALLETKREKTRRLKLEKKGVIAPLSVDSSGDSELAWMLRVSASRLQLVKLDCEVAVAAAPSGKTISVKPKKDEDLERVQKRIIRKTSTLKTRKSKIDSTEPAVIPDNDASKTLENKVSAVSRTRKAKTLDSSAIIVKDVKEENIQKDKEKTDSPILLSCQNIIENLNTALIFPKKHEQCNAQWNTDILSISPMESREYSKFPSVTRILNATMSDDAKKMLELWMAKMINQLGQEGFDNYKRGLLQNGKLLHSIIDGTLRKSPVEVPDHLKSCFHSMKRVLDEVQDVRVIESQVVHRDLGYRGIVDCVAEYKGNLCLIDWKKSDKTKHLLSSTYDAPLQVASYIGALNADKNYPFQIKSGLLVIGYTIGDPPTVFTMDEKKLQYYWKNWLERLKKYYAMQNT